MRLMKLKKKMNKKLFSFDQISKYCEHRDYGFMPFVCALKSPIGGCCAEDCQGLWGKGEVVHGEVEELA